MSAQKSTVALVSLSLGCVACSASDSPDEAAPITMMAGPVQGAEAGVAGDASWPLDAGVPQSFDAALPFDAGLVGVVDAGVVVEAGTPTGPNAGAVDAAQPATDGAEPPVDAASSPDAAVIDASAEASAPVAAPPAFEKTRCIDPSEAKPGVEVNFPCDGVDLWVALPAQCMQRRCGLIFNIHGGGMYDHATMDEATHMIALGNQADYVVVHPHKGLWDVGKDKDAVFGFLQQTVQAFDIDEKRVHSTGYSQGGQISWALACEHADVVASIAPAEEINRVTNCWKPDKLPVREIPILFAYGKRDSIGGGYTAARELASNVAKAWQMAGPETIAGAEGSSYWRQRWTSASGNVFEFISQDYTSSGVGGVLNGHCLPMHDGATFVNCSRPVDYDWGAEVVRFFQAHPM